MTQALDAAVRAACAASKTEHPCICRRDNRPAATFGAPRCREMQAATFAALRAALPAEPTPEMLEAMVDEMTGHDPSWLPGEEEGMAQRAYRALRAHLLGEDA